MRHANGRDISLGLRYVIVDCVVMTTRIIFGREYTGGEHSAYTLRDAETEINGHLGLNKRCINV